MVDEKRPDPPTIDILLLSPLRARGGLRDHADNFRDWLENLYGISVTLHENEDQCHAPAVVVEFGLGASRARDLVSVVRFLRRRGQAVFIDVHEPIRGCFSRSDVKELNAIANRLIYWSEAVARFDRSTNFMVIPLPPYRGFNPQPNDNLGLTIGYFGYGSRNKNLDLILSEIQSLGVHGTVILSTNDEAVSRIGPAGNIDRLLRKEAQSTEIVLRAGYLPVPALAAQLSKCSHFLFAHDSSPQASGTMTIARQLSRPVVALESFQSRITGVISVPVIGSRPACLWRRIRSAIWATVKYGSPMAGSPDFTFRGLVKSFVGPLFGPRLTIQYLKLLETEYSPPTNENDPISIQMYVALIKSQLGQPAE